MHRLISLLHIHYQLMTGRSICHQVDGFFKRLTIDEDEVTCPQCRRLLAEREERESAEKGGE